MQGRVFNIQRFSVHDGPGIRTTVFLKGCPLSCKWCHNPEGINVNQELLFNAKKCIECKKCSSVCTKNAHNFNNSKQLNFIDRKNCNTCGQCIKVCSSTALSLAYSLYSPEEILKEISKDNDFYDCDGGITISGGEPLLQSNFVKEVFKLHKENGYTTTLDTSGCVPWYNFKKVLPYTDLILYDIKAITPEIHQQHTGVDNKIIIENFKRLNDENTRIWVRIPLIPGFNDNIDEFNKIANLIKNQRNVEKVEIIPYHSIGKNKYNLVGREYTYDSSLSNSKEMVAKLSNLLPIYR